MNKVKLSITLMLFVCTSFVFAASLPTPMLEDAANKIITTLKNNKGQIKHNKQMIHRAVSRYLLPHVDVKGMARSVLGRQAWNGASASEKQAFTEAFTQLVIRTYATPLTEYTDETIRFLPQRGSSEGRFTRVSSVIQRSNGQNIPLTYSLVSKSGDWKIYDLSIEGVSLLQSFRSQFAQALQSESLKELIAQMNKQDKAA